MEIPTTAVGEQSHRSRHAAIEPVHTTKVTTVLRRLRGMLPAVVCLATVLIGWELIVRRMHVRVLYVPAPSTIFTHLWENPAFFWKHARVTLYEAGWGFALGAGFALVASIVMAEWKVMERALLPLFVLIKVTPGVALAPVFIIMMGFGAGPKILVAALTIFYTVLVNSFTGFKAVDEHALEVLKSVNASRWEIFWRLRLHNALPHLFSAAKIAGPLAILGAVFGEMQNSKEGLGNVILTASHNINMVRLWAAIFVLMFIGVALVSLLGMLERRLLSWHVSQKI